MKYLPVAVVVAVVLLSAGANAAETYSTKYDNANVDDILKNERLLNQYYNCLLDKGKCTPDGTELKAHLPDALKTGCNKCSEKQKAGSEKVIRFLIEEKPDMYKELEAKYDPEGVYKKKYKAEAEKRGIKV